MDHHSIEGKIMALLLWVLSIFKGEHLSIIPELYSFVLQWRLRVLIPLDLGLLNLHDAAAVHNSLNNRQWIIFSGPNSLAILLQVAGILQSWP